jgi:drug/metabolite transporter (DMT)-like permease
MIKGKHSVILLIFVSAIFISLSSIFASKATVSGDQVVLYRFLFAALITLPLCRRSSNKDSATNKKWSNSTTKKMIFLLVLTSFTASLFYILALLNTSVTHVMLISSISPMMIVLTNKIRGKTIQNIQLVGLCLATLGVFLLISSKGSHNASHMGDVFALFSTTVCIFNIKIISLVKQNTEFNGFLIGNLSDIGMLAYFFLKGLLITGLGISSSQIGLIIAWTVLSKTGWLLLIELSKTAEVYQIQMGNLLNPLVGTSTAIFLGMEQISLVLALGSVMILLGVALSQQLIKMPKLPTITDELVAGSVINYDFTHKPRGIKLTKLAA